MNSSQPVRIRYSVTIIILVLVVFLGAIFLSLTLRTRTLLQDSILSQARSHYQSIMSNRLWNAEHSGVYVLKNVEGDLNHPERSDIIGADGQVYTKQKPALMSRDLSRLATLGSGMIFHMTSLKPLNPVNMADSFEAEALHLFETGQKEVYRFSELEGQKVFRYMAPLKTTEICLGCHARQGYHLGDIRGGISVTILVQNLEEKLRNNIIQIGIFGFIVTLILVIVVGILILRLVRLLDQARVDMEKLAISDGLTGIFNRRHGMRLLAGEINKAQRLAYTLTCLIIDIDHFKKINDTYGHVNGDKALKVLTEELQNVLRTYDVLFRYGGEEFIILFPGMNSVDARTCAERIRQMCAELKITTNDGQQFTMTLSGGLTELKEGDLTGDKIIHRADEALYQAKSNGRNRIEEST